MAFRSNISTAPREEIAAAIMQGAGLNKSLIWEQIAPPLPLNERTAHLPKLTIAGAEMARIVQEVSAPGANVPRLTATIGDFSFSPEIRKREIAIPLEENMTYSRLFSLEQFYGVQIGKTGLSVTIEYLTALEVFSTANFGSATNSGVAYTAANLETISLIADLIAGLERVRDKGEEPDTIVIPSKVMGRVAQGKLVKEFVAGSLAAGSEVTAAALETALNNQGYGVKVLVGRAKYNDGAKDKVNLKDIWSTSYIWVGRAGYRNDTSDEGVPVLDGAIATAYWEPFGLMFGESYEEKPTDSVVVRGKTSANPTVFNANAGTLIATQYA